MPFFRDPVPTSGNLEESIVDLENLNKRSYVDTVPILLRKLEANLLHAQIKNRNLAVASSSLLLDCFLIA